MHESDLSVFFFIFLEQEKRQNNCLLRPLFLRIFFEESTCPRKKRVFKNRESIHFWLLNGEEEIALFLESLFRMIFAFV